VIKYLGSKQETEPPDADLPPRHAPPAAASARPERRRCCSRVLRDGYGTKVGFDKAELANIEP